MRTLKKRLLLCCVLAGLLGIGGGMLLVPAFKLGYAMDSLRKATMWI